MTATEAGASTYPVFVNRSETALLFERWKQAFAFESWADEELVLCLAAHPAREREAGLLAHILGAQWLWLARIGRPSTEVPVWPSWTPPESHLELHALRAAWRSLFDELTAEESRRRVTYTNSKGEPWDNSVAEILDHVLLHGAHHRGQVVQLLGAANIEAPYIDFIQAVRTKKI